MGSKKYVVDETVVQPTPLIPSWRATLCFAGMLGGVLLYSMRVNMSLAIVCMVREPTRNTTATANATQSPDDCQPNEGQGPPRTRQGEFNWDRNLRGFILSSFFIGYMLTQLPGGWLARMYGGRRVVGFGTLTLMVATLLIPEGARASPYVVIALRIICGLGSGVYFPAFNAMWAHWAPPMERTKLFTLVLAGNNLGSIITFSASGYLCEYGFDNGWPSIFYIFGATALPWLVFWFLAMADTPAVHPRISEAEVKYIQDSLGHTDQEVERPPTPWRHLLTSVPVYAIFVTHFCYAWAGYTILTSLPQYMRDVLKFDIRANGLINALPYASAFIVTMIVAYASDKIIKKGVFSVSLVRKFVQSIGFIPPAIICFGIGFLNCHQRAGAVVLLCIATGLLSCGRAGFLTTMIDMAPRFGAEILGISNTIGTVAGIISPIAASSLTPQGTQEQWRNVFYVCGTLMVVGELAFVIFATSKVQDWALDKTIADTELQVTSDGDTINYITYVKPTDTQLQMTSSEKTGNYIGDTKPSVYVNKGFERPEDSGLHKR